MSIHRLPHNVVQAVFHTLTGTMQMPVCDACDEFIARCSEAVGVAYDTDEWVIAPNGTAQVTEVTLWHCDCLPEDMRRLFEHQARAEAWRWN